MPYINLKVIGSLSDEQKQNIVKEFTQTLFTIAGKPPEATDIIIEEISPKNWGKNSKLIG